MEDSRVRRGIPPYLSWAPSRPPRHPRPALAGRARLPDCSLQLARLPTERGWRKAAENRLGDLLADWGSPAESSVAWHWPTTVAHPPSCRCRFSCSNKLGRAAIGAVTPSGGGMPTALRFSIAVLDGAGQASLMARCHRGNPGSGREKHICRQVGGTFSVRRGEDGQRLQR